MPFSDKNFNDFLRSFLTNIKEELPGNSFRFCDFEDAYNKSKIALEKPEQWPENEKEDLSWVDQFRTTLFHICRIINDPRHTITSYKEALGVEKIVKIDSQDVMESSKKDIYWDRRSTGEVTPKKFSTSINERDICIYENKFVVFVIDLMLGFVAQHIFRIKKNLRFLHQNFADENFSYKDAENLLDLARFEQFKHNGKILPPQYLPLLTSNKSDTIRNLETLEFFKKELLRITYTSFYQIVKKSGQITYERVYATNLLLGDHNYSEIFNFYRNFLTIKLEKPYKAPIYKPWYNDYVAITLLMTLKELGFEFNKNRIMFTDVHHFILENYNCEKEGIRCHINMDNKKNIIEVTFSVQYIEGKFHKLTNLTRKRDSKLCFIMLANPKTDDDTEARNLYRSLINKRLETGEYTNAFIVSPHDEFNFTNCIIVSPFASNVDINLKNVIQSSLIFTEGDAKMYSKFCPICGSRVDGEWEDGNCHCPECNSIWTSFVSGDNHTYQNTVWLKAIKRPL